MGKRVIAPGINAIKTWEGFAGGTIAATLAGMGLWWVTPFSPIQAGIMAMMLAVMGFLGSMTMSAIKRDRGVHDYGTLVEGHIGVLDRFDSICFAAPVFFHITRFFFT
jgi:phosphatidate cytidylyltransferase